MRGRTRGAYQSLQRRFGADTYYIDDKDDSVLAIVTHTLAKKGRAMAITNSKLCTQCTKRYLKHGCKVSGTVYGNN